MTESELFPVGIIKPDARGRFAVGKWMTAEPVIEWRLFRSRDGRELTIKAVTA